MSDLLERRPWIRLYDYKSPDTIRYPIFPAHEMLRNTANLVPDKVATWFYGTEITYWDLYLTTIRMANGLIEAGVKKGDRVGILLPNSPQFVISFWSLLAAGAIIVNLNPMYTVDELKFMVENTGLTGLITFDGVLPNVKRLCETVDIPLVLVTKLSDYINGLETSTPEDLGLESNWHHFSQFLDRCTCDKPPRVGINQADEALIQFTGGTTGIPKGATLTHRNLVSATYVVSLGGSALLDDITLDRRHVLCTLPFFHVYGEIVAMSYSVFTISTMIILPRSNLACFLTISFFRTRGQWTCPLVPICLFQSLC